MSDPNWIEACKELVKYGIAAGFVDAEPMIVTNTPDRIIVYGSVELWAQHLGEGEILLNPRMPSILRWLSNLTERGTGPAEDYQGIRYKFVNSMLPASLSTSGEKC